MPVDRKELVEVLRGDRGNLGSVRVDEQLSSGRRTLVGCSHHTVEHWVTMRDKGLLPDGTTLAERVKLIDGFMPKIEEWVERSNGRVRGDVVFDKLDLARLRRVGPYRPPSARDREVELEGRPAAGLSAVGCRAGDVGAVGLGSRPEDRRATDVSVLRVVGVVPVPGRVRRVGQDVADRDRVLGPFDARVRGCADVLVDGQRTNRLHRPHRRDRGPASVDRCRSATTTASRSRRAFRRTLKPRAVSSAPFRSPKQIWSRPIPTCSTPTPPGRSLSRRAPRLWSRSTGASIESPAGRRSR